MNSDSAPRSGAAPLRPPPQPGPPFSTARPQRPSAAQRSALEPPDNSLLLPLASCILWIACLAVGILGMLIPFPRPAPAPPDKLTQFVNVQIPKPPPLPLPPPDALPPPPPAAPSLAAPAPASLPPLAIPAAPQVTPVAAPTAAVAFAVPVEGLTRIVDVDQAAHAAPRTAGGPGNAGAAPAPPPAPKPPPTSAPAPAPPSVARLTFGQGEGRQPAPQYPRESVLAHQEGTVLLRFSVDQTGTVGSVEVASPSRWPALNQAAVRAVRDTWRFTPGAPRIFEVPIQFQLSR